MSYENLELDNVLGDLVVKMGRTYDETRKKFPRGVELIIDGFKVTVPAIKAGFSPDDSAVPAMFTTVIDATRILYSTNAAARAFYEKAFPERSASLRLQTAADDPSGIAWDYFPIPALCHQEHMKPVYVCRVCMVEASYRKKRTLFPSCFLPVTACDPGSEIKTIATSERVCKSARTVTELLLSDYDTPKFAGISVDSSSKELLRVAEQLGCKADRFPRTAPQRTRDESSSVIAVDLNACILCDRCVRACNEIKNNQVIGRQGKGYGTGIAFDLNNLMDESSCVACGECMVSCPTGALTRRGQVLPEAAKTLTPDSEPLSAQQLKHEIRNRNLFKDISDTFLDWNRGAAVRRKVRAGEVLCKQGEFGRTAFLIEKGRYKIFINPPTHEAKRRQSGILGVFGKLQTIFRGAGADSPQRDRQIQIDAPVALPYGNPAAELGPEHLMFGEMTCMNHQPRSATVVALEDGEVIEIFRNVLYMMQRGETAREVLDRRYRQTMLGNLLKNLPFYAPGSEEFLSAAIELKRYSPGMEMFAEGDPADHFYIVLSGHVKLTKHHPGGERVLRYLTKGDYFGEMGLLTDLAELRDARLNGLRSAGARALDHVDLARIRGEDLRELVEQFPEVRRQFVKKIQTHLADNEAWEQQLAAQQATMSNFLDQGLVIGQKLLVLDLEKCTRCDECTRACADAHDGVSRLTREGMRFDKYLVASACRSCMDPFCLVGCPVGSIGRTVNGQIQIEDWCIGCGKCAENCPYGNINMHELPNPDPAQRGELVTKAVTCDLCTSLSKGNRDYVPACIYACPHDAAHRESGPELLKLVEAARRG